MADRKVNPNSAFFTEPTKVGNQINITNNTLPQLAFSHSQRALFPTKAKKKRWYHNINYHYSSRFTNNVKNYYESEAYAVNDSTTGYRWIMDENANLTENTFSDYIMSHSSGLNMSLSLIHI